MKTILTTIVLAGALALGACSDETYTMNGEHILIATKDGYQVTVTDQERERIRGTLPRDVVLQAESFGATPYRISGSTRNVLAPRPSFVEGRIWHTATDKTGCYWGTPPTDSDPPRCGETEISNAQAVLAKYAGYVSK